MRRNQNQQHGKAKTLMRKRQNTSLDTSDLLIEMRLNGTNLSSVSASAISQAL